MPFFDREDAGRKLGEALSDFQSRKDTIVVALPRGGVVVGFYVAQALHLPLDIVCPRKLGAPGNPEYAIGVVTEEGQIIRTVDYPANLEEIAAKEIVIAQERVRLLRAGLPKRSFKDKTVLLVDDGLATGSTMLGAIETVKEAKEVILAVPVAPRDSIEKFKKRVNKIVCLETPAAFFAVGQFYTHFDQTTDGEVKELLTRSRRTSKSHQ